MSHLLTFHKKNLWQNITSNCLVQCTTYWNWDWMWYPASATGRFPARPLHCRWLVDERWRWWGWITRCCWLVGTSCRSSLFHLPATLDPQISFLTKQTKTAWNESIRLCIRYIMKGRNCLVLSSPCRRCGWSWRQVKTVGDRTFPKCFKIRCGQFCLVSTQFSITLKIRV